MAKEPGREQSADDLKMEIARSRDRMSRDLRVFRREIDIPRKIKRSFQQQTGAWITAAVVVGALLIVLPARKKIVKVEARRKKSGKENKLVEAGFALGALKFAATILRPMIVSFVTKKMRGYMDDLHTQPGAKRRSVI
jgi:hypothetical protein